MRAVTVAGLKLGESVRPAGSDLAFTPKLTQAANSIQFLWGFEPASRAVDLQWSARVRNNLHLWMTNFSPMVHY
jgi:hypothetical protein